MLTKVEGVIVYEMDYLESSKIIHIITREYGLISAIAKGAKKLKSNLRSVTSKLTYGYFHLYFKEDKLSILFDVDIIDNFRNIKSDLISIGYASYVCDLTNQVLKQHIGEKIDESLYDAFIATLIKINEKYDPMIITNILELKALDYLGVMPILDGCVICGTKNAIITISSEKSGYLCSNCRTNEPILDEKVVKLIRMYYYVDISKITKLDISEDIKNQINQFIANYYDKHTGLYFKSKQFIEDIKM